MWHCPHCGAPQAESARCWVCRRSSTTCSTCRHFQRSLAADVGYCGLDARRKPLTGLEMRGCWEARAVAVQDVAKVPQPEAHRLRAAAPARPASIAFGFVPIDELDQQSGDEARPGDPAREPNGTAEEPAVEVPEVPPFVIADAIDDWSERRNLFGDPEA